MIQGIDASVYQGEMQWDIARMAGTRFGAARATVGNYYTDPQFAANWQGMKSAGVARTGYHVIRPEIDAITQADLFSYAIGVEPPDFPLVLDVEVKMSLTEKLLNRQKAKSYEPAAYVMRVHQVADILVRRFGETPFLYSYPYFIRDNLRSDSSLTRFPLWISNTAIGLNKVLSKPDIPAPFTDWVFWQYLTDNSDDGYSWGAQSRALDRNYFNGTWEQFTALWPQDGEREPMTVEERLTLLEGGYGSLRRDLGILAQSIAFMQETQSDPLLTRSGLSVKAEKATLYEPHPSRPSILTSAKRNLTKGSAVEIGKRQRWQVDTASAGEFGQLPNGYWVRMSELG